MDMNASSQGSAPRTASTPTRRPYTRPELVAYGPLAKLTRGTQSGTGENTAQGGMKKNCL
jgi:hypothetical protein